MIVKSRNNKGFTIVELLIVIVVIGILAAITIVAYNGISERARMASITAFVSQIKHANLQDATGNWSFDECSGSTIGASNGAATATTTSTIYWSSDTPTGTGCSIQFNNTYQITTTAKISSTYYFKGAWVKQAVGNTCGGGNIISDATLSTTATAFYGPGCTLTSGHNGSWALVADTKSIADGKWHYVAIEFTADAAASTGVLKFYRDGVVTSINNSAAKPVGTDTATMAIGGYQNNNFFSGWIDDPIIIAR